LTPHPFSTDTLILCFRGRVDNRYLLKVKDTMAEIREVNDRGEVVEQPKTEVKTTGQVLEVPALDPLEVATHQVLGLETDSDKSRYDAKVKTIVEWAKQVTEDHTPEGIKWAIRDMQMKIGSPKVGESFIDYLHSYVALATQKKDIDSKLKKYNPYG